MAEITRTIRVNLTPAEMAALFADYTSQDQAEFFDALFPIIGTWAPMGWQIQCNELCGRLSLSGQRVVADLADAYIASITP